MKIKLNNKEINVLEGEKLIETIRREGFDVPSLCYAKGMKHQASCMVCVVKDNASGQIIPSCTTFPVEGMQIDSESDEVRDLRRQSLELLLSDHMAVCRAPCDVKKCSLRKLAVEYRAKWNRFPRYSAIKDAQAQHIKDNLWFDVTKCIRCGLCVYNTDNGFTFKDRGFGMQIVLPKENQANVGKEIAELCPTSAIYFENAD